MSKVAAHWGVDSKGCRAEGCTCTANIDHYQWGYSRPTNGLGIGRKIWSRRHYDRPRDFQKTHLLLKKAREHSSEELIALLRLQLDLQDQYAQIIPRSITGLHRFFKIYVKGFPGANDLRVQLMNTKTTDEVRAILDTFQANKNR